MQQKKEVPIDVAPFRPDTEHRKLRKERLMKTKENLAAGTAEETTLPEGTEYPGASLPDLSKVEASALAVPHLHLHQCQP